MASLCCPKAHARTAEQQPCICARREAQHGAGLGMRPCEGRRGSLVALAGAPAQQRLSHRGRACARCACSAGVRQRLLCPSQPPVLCKAAAYGWLVCRQQLAVSTSAACMAVVGRLLVGCAVQAYLRMALLSQISTSSSTYLPAQGQLRLRQLGARAARVHSDAFCFPGCHPHHAHIHAQSAGACGVWGPTMQPWVGIPTVSAGC